MNFDFKCPVCGEKLEIQDKTLKCINNHSFDIAKQGYVNLLISQKSSKKRHGDDNLMVAARRNFLDKGYYDCLVEKILEAFSLYAKAEMTVADLGCGECRYTTAIADYCKKNKIQAKIAAMDISKQALIYGSKRCKELNLVVGSINDIPIQDNSCDAVFNIFAPDSPAEIQRILKEDGVWIKAYPLERHLYGLKSVIYDSPYLNTVEHGAPDGFCEKAYFEVKKNICINGNEDIMNLFMMTPYYYKTGKQDQQKVEGMNELLTEIEFGISVYLPKA